jgi:hypothetical protein
LEESIGYTPIQRCLLAAHPMLHNKRIPQLDLRVSRWIGCEYQRRLCG